MRFGEKEGECKARGSEVITLQLQRYKRYSLYSDTIASHARTHARSGRLTYCRLLLLRQTHKAQRLSVSALFADKMSFL